jgi:2-oxoisovalerate dehydrogenase E1 component
VAAREHDIRARFLSFIADRYPLAWTVAAQALQSSSERAPTDPADTIRFGRDVREKLDAQLTRVPLAGLPDCTPGVPAGERLATAHAELLAACDGFFAREAIAASLTPDERREILRGMVLTRVLDNRLKRFFTSGEVRFGETPFQGKGFRSLGQEAIYAAAIRLQRGDTYLADDGWHGDVIGPIIRDVGAALAMRPGAETIRMVLNAQMGKAGPPMDGRDLHIGDFAHGILPASAPLTISTLTLVGMALAFKRRASHRVAISFIGDGGTSLGEWHEAINAAAVHRLPMVFCVENNQVALSTPVTSNSAAHRFADKAVGYGIPGVSLDGTDPDAIAAAFAWATGRARAGEGPTLLELISMRMSGHAHHDDMLYLGSDPALSLEYPRLPERGGYVDRERYAFWAAKDPIATYAARLEAEGVIAAADLDTMRADAEALVEAEAEAVIRTPWPVPASIRLDPSSSTPAATTNSPADGQRATNHLRVGTSIPYDAGGHTFLEAIAIGLADVMRVDPRVFIYGEDVAAPYGNAFLLLRPLLPEFADRVIDSPLSEAAIVGVCTGAALAGLRPIGEMQFNDFVATGFNQLVNNAAKIRFRWNGDVPMVIRMPWGGRRHAGPYHSQNTEAWFYRTPGIKIVAPSTPEDARALLATAVADRDPVLFYEHIALYRDPTIKQRLPAQAPPPIPLGIAALRREGDDIVIITYGAYVHVAMRVASRLSRDGIEASVLDLRSLAPLDRNAILALVQRCSRVLIVHEDSRTGSIGESIAAIIQEEAFDWLDAPIQIVGALDTPVPYSPPLEAAFLPSEDEIERVARWLVAY